MIDKLSAAVEDRIGSAVKSVIRRNKLPKNFLYFVRGVFVMAALLEEFPPQFFRTCPRATFWCFNLVSANQRMHRRRRSGPF